MAGLRESLRGKFEALGFDEVRFASAAEPIESRLLPWIGDGHHADMHWMERSAAKRLSPEKVLPGVRSIVLLGVNYASAAEKEGVATRKMPHLPRHDPLKPVWARYALYEDYHERIKPALVRAGRILEEECGLAPDDYRYYVDTGPVLERAWSARAGMGFIGKNAMLISRRHGNWLLLSAILSRGEIPPDPPIRRRAGPLPAATGGVGLLCGACTRCLDACPTHAFARPGVVDARRCISYQTIENRGVIPRELRAGIGARVFGCDVCLEVCPWNRFARSGRSSLLAARPAIGELTLRDLLDLTPEAFAGRFRRTPIKRLKLAGLLRNACVAAGNSGDTSLLPSLLRLAENASPVVRVHAVWAVHRLGGGERLRSARAAETDPAVLAEYGSPAEPA